jgi:tetratricopeptide (TPR) repeat protein
MANWNPRANELFLNALDLPSGTERQAYLDTACGEDAPLRQAVEALLQAHAAAGALLERPTETGHLAPAAGEDKAGVVIAGRYKLLQQIGEGGMGTVWMADQLEPIRRQVAVKLIKPGMDSAQVLARFEAERQALALMDHPNIAKVHDAGTTDGGRPFFVMELVKGVPITRYCDDQQLTPRQRLALMTQVCQAVQHAHQKGVIHRDLKPSNVLVAAYDGRPVPKVIDFGIAKAVGQRLTERTLFTGFGGIVGTLEYMSPEQAEFNALDIDTRADVYSLGVLLYELLTGSTPLPRQRLQKAALLEVLRLIREEEPPRPSTRLSESKEALGTLSLQRRTEPGRLARQLRGELDWIVMKALEKDRGRRYETADSLARDIERYLADEAVEAGPPSRVYRIKKLVGRHRALFVGTGLVVLALAGGVIGTSWGLLRALDAEQIARTAQIAADTEKDKAIAAEADTRAFSDFLLFQVLAVARLKGQAQNVPTRVTIAEAIAESEQRIDELFKDKPTAEADLRHALGQTWRNMGKYAAAEKHFRRAWELRRQHLGEDAPRTLSSQRCLGGTLEESGRAVDAIPILADALKRHRTILGTDDKETLLCVDNLAAAYLRNDRPADALALQVEAVERGERIDAPTSTDMLRRLNRLAVTYMTLNRPGEAVPILQKALDGMKAVNPNHAETVRCMSRLVAAYTAMKAFDKAIPILQQLLDLQQKTNDPEALRTIQSLAIGYAETGQLDKLRPLLQEYLNQEMWVSKAPAAMPMIDVEPPGLDHGKTPAEPDDALGAVARVLVRQAKHGLAEEYLRTGLASRERTQPRSLKTAETRLLLGMVLVGRKSYPAAEALLLTGYEDLCKVQPAVRQERLREAVEQLVRLYEGWGKMDKAQAWRKRLNETK